MTKFIVHTAVHGEGRRSESFAPGDDVPDWALPFVKAHVVDELPEVEYPTVEADLEQAEESTGGESEENPEDETPEVTEAPALDFSAGAKAPAKTAAKPPRKK